MATEVGRLGFEFKLFRDRSDYTDKQINKGLEIARKKAKELWRLNDGAVEDYIKMHRRWYCDNIFGIYDPEKMMVEVYVDHIWRVAKGDMKCFLALLEEVILHEFVHTLIKPENFENQARVDEFVEWVLIEKWCQERNLVLGKDIAFIVFEDNKVRERKPPPWFRVIREKKT